MKRIFTLLKVVVALSFVAMLVMGVSAQDEKEYIVYPSFRTFFMREESSPSGGFLVGENELRDLLDAGMVDWYEENIEGEFCDSAYDPIYTDYYEQYELNLIKAKEAWELGCFGQGIKVAVIDTGVNPHEEFENRLLEGYDFYNNKKEAEDAVGHGTLVAGVVASAADGYGTKGLASRAQIVPLKVDNSNGNPDLFAVCNAIRAAVDEYDCDVINLSLGFRENANNLKSLENAVNYAEENGVTVIAAVGNYSIDSSNNIIVNNAAFYPAAFENVIGVGSVSCETEQVSLFSVKNSSVFILAPGEDIRAPITIFDEKGEVVSGYMKSSGTSLASPVVAASVAVLKNVKPELTPGEIREILKDSAVDAGDSGYDVDYGYGILDVKAAVRLALGVDLHDAQERVSYMVRASLPALNEAVTVEDYVTGYVGSCVRGQRVVALAAPKYVSGEDTYTFRYWANGNGTYVSEKNEYSFNANSPFTLEAVYEKETQKASKTVQFWNGNGVLIETVEVNAGNLIDKDKIPEAEITGYLFDMWKKDDGSIFTAETELSEKLTRVVAQFKDNEKVSYTATFLDSAGNSKKNGLYGDFVEHTAADVENFDYWMIGNSIISYEPTIKIALWGDVTLTAIYDDESEVRLPSVFLDVKNGEKFIVFNVPEGYTMLDAGIVFGVEGRSPAVSSFMSKSSVKKSGSFGQFTAKPGNETHTVARGYVLYKNESTNTVRVVYSD